MVWVWLNHMAQTQGTKSKPQVASWSLYWETNHTGGSIILSYVRTWCRVRTEDNWLVIAFGGYIVSSGAHPVVPRQNQIAVVRAAYEIRMNRWTPDFLLGEYSQRVTVRFPKNMIFAQLRYFVLTLLDFYPLEGQNRQFQKVNGKPI